MSNVLVFGHQNPDNDAIMSAVVLSQLLNQVEYQGNTYTACCLGPLPAESAKLLEDAGVPAPTLIDAIEPAAEGAEPQQVVLTDHNEPGQSVAGLENAVIAGVVDHHRFGDFTTAARCTSWRCLGAPPAPSWPSCSRFWALSPRTRRPSCCCPP